MNPLDYLTGVSEFINMVTVEINKIKTLSELAPLFSVSEEQLNFFLAPSKPLIVQALLSRRFGAPRAISIVIDDPLRHFLKEVSLFLSQRYLLIMPFSAHGFIKGRSVITNAQQHTQKKVVLNLDIKRFFDSISLEKIVESFIFFGFQRDMATVLARLLTINGRLATGFSTSPVLSNIVCVDMDNELQLLAGRYDATYTRYADDLTFSTHNFLPLRKEIEAILKKYSFSINASKCRLFRRGGPQYVTGLTVVDSKPRLSRQLKRAIRLELYYIKKYGFRGHFYYGLKKAAEIGAYPSNFSLIAFHGYGFGGFTAFVNSIEPNLAKKIRDTLSQEEFFESTFGVK